VGRGGAGGEGPETLRRKRHTAPSAGIAATIQHAKAQRGADKPLSAQERAFIEALAEAAENETPIARWEAAKLAGYGTAESSKESLAAMAYQVSQRPHVRAAIAEEIRQRMAVGAQLSAFAAFMRLLNRRDPSEAAVFRAMEAHGTLPGASSQPATVAVQVVVAGPGFDWRAYAGQSSGPIVESEEEQGQASEAHSL
jgi:hypothetical protein